MASSPHVYFEGNWSARERELVQAAAEAAEASGLPTPVPKLGAPWVATRQVLGDTHFFLAARQQGESALMARTADGLAERIRQFAERNNSAPSSDSLFQLVYESTAAQSMTDDVLQEILQEARRKNEERDITGLLLYAQGRFMQVLEGPEAAVRELYTSIQKDDRHTNVETLMTTSTTARTFPAWAMGLKRPEIVEGNEELSSFLQTGELPDASPMVDVVEALERFRHDTSPE